jgi:hypothetical protein
LMVTTSNGSSCNTIKQLALSRCTKNEYQCLRNTSSSCITSMQYACYWNWWKIQN